MNRTQEVKLGEMALEIISDYPLYANTSNITYAEAIKVAKIFYPDPADWAEVIGQDGMKGV